MTNVAIFKSLVENDNGMTLSWCDEMDLLKNCKNKWHSTRFFIFNYLSNMLKVCHSPKTHDIFYSLIFCIVWDFNHCMIIYSFRSKNACNIITILSTIFKKTLQLHQSSALLMPSTLTCSPVSKGNETSKWDQGHIISILACLELSDLSICWFYL